MLVLLFIAMPSCENGLMLLIMYILLKIYFTNYCCTCINIGKIIHIFVYKLCKIEINAAAFYKFSNIDIIQRDRLFIIWLSNLIFFSYYLAAMREKSCSLQLHCYYTV